ncbi:MAG TPA: RecX family transcriptional regulator [Anaerolineaceae bacterium]|nr:RecX family transcriptional regulator [Anaerolineaceae bacterium]
MARKITRLSVQKKNPNRVNVYLDGEYAFGLARIVAAWLSVGQELTDEKIEEYQRQDVKEVAYQTALRLLSYRARTETELRQRLERKGHSEEVIEQTMERLHANGLINDHQFAQDWVDNQSNFRPRGRRLLRMELRQKGVDDSAISNALSDAQDEAELAYQAAQRPAKRLAGLPWLEFRQKLSQSLARRGFTYDTIAPTVSRLWAELQSPEAPPESGNANDIEEE